MCAAAGSRWGCTVRWCCTFVSGLVGAVGGLSLTAKVGLVGWLQQSLPHECVSLTQAHAHRESPTHPQRAADRLDPEPDPPPTPRRGDGQRKRAARADVRRCAACPTSARRRRRPAPRRGAELPAPGRGGHVADAGPADTGHVVGSPQR